MNNFIKKTTKGKLGMNRQTDLGEHNLFNDVKDLKDYNDPDQRMEEAAILAIQEELHGGGVGANFGMDQQAEAHEEA